MQFKRVQAEKRLKEVQEKWSVREEEIKNLEERVQNIIMNLKEDLVRKENEIKLLKENYNEKSNENHRLKAAYDLIRFAPGKSTNSALTFIDNPSLRTSMRFNSPPMSSGSNASTNGSRSAFIQKQNSQSRSMYTPSQSPFTKLDSTSHSNVIKRPLTPSFLKKTKTSVNNLLFSPPPRKAIE